MKKVFVISSLILIILILSNRKEIRPVMNINSDNDYNEYYLSFDKNEITTKNFLNIFEDKKIIEIYPYISVSYKGKVIDKYKKYEFDFNSNKRNIEKFEYNYINFIKNKGFYTESVNLKINGISINKVKLITNIEEINKLKSVSNTIQYSLTF